MKVSVAATTRKRPIGSENVETTGNYKEIDYGRLVKVRERLKNHLPTAPFTILRFPDPRLRKKARPVEEVTDEVRKIADDMLTTMYASAGVGLAATQVDVQKQIIVIDVSEQRNHPMCLINPEIVEREGKAESMEGCLSVPDFRATVTRAARVKVAALDRDGREIEFEASGLLADCVQHEIDHLQGKLFIDYLSPLKRLRLLSQVKKQQKKAARQAP